MSYRYQLGLAEPLCHLKFGNNTNSTRRVNRNSSVQYLISIKRRTKKIFDEYPQSLSLKFTYDFSGGRSYKTGY